MAQMRHLRRQAPAAGKGACRCLLGQGLACLTVGPPWSRRVLRSASSLDSSPPSRAAQYSQDVLLYCVLNDPIRTDVNPSIGLNSNTSDRAWQLAIANTLARARWHWYLRRELEPSDLLVSPPGSTKSAMLHGFIGQVRHCGIGTGEPWMLMHPRFDHECYLTVSRLSLTGPTQRARVRGAPRPPGCLPSAAP